MLVLCTWCFMRYKINLSQWIYLPTGKYHFRYCVICVSFGAALEYISFIVGRNRQGAFVVQKVFLNCYSFREFIHSISYVVDFKICFTIIFRQLCNIKDLYSVYRNFLNKTLLSWFYCLLVHLTSALWRSWIKFQTSAI